MPPAEVYRALLDIGVRSENMRFATGCRFSVALFTAPIPYHVQLHERTSDLAANEAIETLYWLLSMHPPSRTSLAWRSQGTAVS